MSAVATSSSLGGGSTYTGPGSAYQQALAEYQMQAAYAQQQYAIAAAKAAKEQERRDRIKSSIIAHRETELAKKARETANRIAGSSSARK